ncbi:MAG: methyltransferase domain-containing protein [Candidatus Nitrosopolaris sp.]
MPSSPYKHISKIMDIIYKLSPNSILDVGAGFGKYGLLCREYLELWDGRQKYHEFIRRIDGVEVYGKYITPVHQFVYNNIYSEDITVLIDKIDFRYDLVLLIDVLEHFDKPTGQSLLEKLLRQNKGVLISTPKNPSAQTDVFENIYETHRAKWTTDELSSFQDSFFIRDSTHRIAYIGTKDSVEKLKRRIFLERVSSIPGTKYVVSAYVKSKKNKEKNP